MNVSKYFLLRVWIVFCLFSSPLLQADTTKTYDREYSLQDIEERLDRIEASIDNFKFGSQKTTQPDTAFLPTNSLKEVSVSKILDQSGTKKNVSENKIYSSPSTKERKFKGFYILPFLGIQSSSNLDWNIFLGSVELDLKHGLSTVLRTGYNWYNFFTELEFSYLKNDIKGTNLPLSGEIDGFGCYLSSGGRLNFNDYISAFAGIGLGGVSQQLELSLGGISLEQSDFLFAYQIFSGLEFRPVNSISLGLRYRWLHIDEMDLFSDRDLHVLEFWMGYLF